MFSTSKHTQLSAPSRDKVQFRPNENGYRYRFNGKENDKETYGDGNALDFGARIYDSRLGRWLSVDPLGHNYQELAPYQFVDNNPLIFIDPDGRWIDWVFSKGVREFRRELRSTENGKMIWKDLKQYKGRIIIKVVNEVTVGENNGVLSLMGGATITPNDFEKIKGKGRNPYFRKTTIYVSLGTQRLISSIEKEVGKPWSEMNMQERNSGLKIELDKNSEYEFLKFSQLSIKPEKSNTKSYCLWAELVRSTPDPNAPAILDYENRSEFMARVGAHEGTHGVNDVQVVNKYKNNQSAPGSEFEIKPFVVERKVTKELGAQRGNK
jgi:RHS repeat-associated protein